MFEVITSGNGLHWIPGVMPDNVLREPDIANCFIVEHDSDVYLIDTGAGPDVREALLNFFVNKQYSSATLINTHIHADHVCNNVVLENIRAEQKTHLVHPASLPLIDLVELAANEIRLSADEGYWAVNFDRPRLLGSAAAAVRSLLRFWPAAAFHTVIPLFGWVHRLKFRPIGSRTQYLTGLEYKDRQKLQVGEHAFDGWRAGHLLLIDDRGHTADSLSVYDPENRLLLAGDLTFEDNPLWPSGTYDRMIENLRAFRALNATEEISTLGDGHHHEIFTGDAIGGLLDRLIATHERRRAAVLEVRDTTDTESIETIRDELISRNEEFSELARAGEFPFVYRSIRAIVALALREANAGTPA